MREASSPNQDDRPGGVDTLVLHYTGMQSGRAAIDRLCDPAAKVSCHYVVEEDGTVWRLVPEARRAWHAGVSAWRGRTGLNDVSIGIEIVNPGHEWGYRPFPAAQMAAVTTLCQAILARWPIPPVNVVGHSDIAPDRKQDPGELFDWPGLAAAGVGLWPGWSAGSVIDDLDPTIHAGPVTATDARPGPHHHSPGSAGDRVEHDLHGQDVASALRAIGYPIPDLATTITAFQRRWLPQGLTGLPDPPTRARIAQVLAAYQA